MGLRIFGSFKGGLRDVKAQARQFEELGFDGAMQEEVAHDPFLPLLLAAEHTNKLLLMTGIAVGFARSPMILATQAHDLNSFSKGRFGLAIGSQIEAHITRRYSMPWSKPAARMREMVEAIKAIQRCWYEGEKLGFAGEFYTHNLMPPLFKPTDLEYGRPPIYTAAVGPLMTQVAGAVSDGILIHPFSTEKYLRALTLPNLKLGADSSSRTIDKCRVCMSPFIVTGEDEASFERAAHAVRDRLAFYGSTPAYRAVLDIHGWGDLQTELHAMTREGRWSEMGSRITDEMLQTFAVVGEIKDIAPMIWRRYGDIVQDAALEHETLGIETLARIGNDLRGCATSAGLREVGQY